MMEHFHSTNDYRTKPTRFGGLIYPSDFETDYRSKTQNQGSSIAQRIASDWKFDEQCKRNIEVRKKKMNKEDICHC